MRLEKVVLDGFKSFADRTEFAFENSITGIVGPNGCGKSNVVDAVKWVFGEQSAKSLRSGRMADVIFSGSSSRKAAGSAEVSLVISNSAGLGTGRLSIDADEVQITRRIYKSGQSEYLINNKVCRLKDVRELFMDTGVGVKAYSIIEQGQVERLLTSSSKERRLIFEEAAGISKYKAHKEEAIRKLERTEQNLLRLADILGEVRSRLRSVKLAAGKARNYLAYSQRLKELQVNYSLAEYDRIEQTRKERTSVLAELEVEFASVAAEVSRGDAAASELGRRIIEAEGQINRTDNSLVSVQSKIEQLCQRIEFLRSRVEELEGRKSSAAERAEQLGEQRKGFEVDLARCRVELEECTRSVADKRGRIEQIKGRISEINGRCASLEAELEDEKSGIIDIVRRTAQLHNEVQSISVYRENLSGQKNRLAGRAESAKAELEKVLREKAGYEARLGDVEKVLAELSERLEAKRGESEQTEKRVEGHNRRLSHSKEALSALGSEFSVLSEMEQRREGIKGGVKSVLARRGELDYVEGILADIISADVEYAPAVEAALEGKTDSVVVSSSSRLMRDAEQLAIDGRVNFICMDKAGPFVDEADFSGLAGAKGRLVEFVNYQGRYGPVVWGLLAKVVVADSVEAGVELSARFGPEYEFVTARGEYVGGGGVIKLGPLGKSTGLISRKSRLRQLQETIEKIRQEIKGLEEEISRDDRASEHLAKVRRELRTAIYEANTEKTQIGSRVSSLEENISRLREEQPLIASEMGLVAEQIERSVQKEYESKQKLEELEAVNTERNERIKELGEQYDRDRAEQQRLGDALTDLKVSLGQAAEHGEALKATIGALEGQLRANATAYESAEQEIRSCAEQSAGASRDILACEGKVSELFVDKEQKQRSSGALHKEIEELIEQQRQTEERLREQRSRQSEIDGRINEVRIELGQLEVKGQDLAERVRDELGLDLAESYESYQDSEVDWEKVREEMGQLRGKIERLGNVNLDAIEEQDGLEAREEFLTCQVEDLNSSKGQLQQLINRLNKKSREKFSETFEQVRVNFQEIFRKLFGGGKADIFLESDEDVLEAGIEIAARPPGKETRSISLLSGGEKAMTAIALLFSVFKAKPSPFCFLDEVDAALDEANNERFNILLREFAKDSQFIIITHAKRTMSIVDMLYGITMQTRGVSKKISVSFEQYEAEPAAA